MSTSRSRGGLNWKGVNQGASAPRRAPTVPPLFTLESFERRLFAGAMLTSAAAGVQIASATQNVVDATSGFPDGAAAPGPGLDAGGAFVSGAGFVDASALTDGGSSSASPQRNLPAHARDSRTGAGDVDLPDVGPGAHDGSFTTIGGGGFFHAPTERASDTAAAQPVDSSAEQVALIDSITMASTSSQGQGNKKQDDGQPPIDTSKPGFKTPLGPTSPPTTPQKPGPGGKNPTGPGTVDGGGGEGGGVALLSGGPGEDVALDCDTFLSGHAPINSGGSGSALPGTHWVELIEGNSFFVGAAWDFTVPQTPGALVFRYEQLDFDETDPDSDDQT
ncbi:MAG: hypothetical protein ACREIT_06035, partial [Tepidisphaeraceae bacterium]